MKKFYSIFLPLVVAMFVCVGFASCSDDEGGENNPEMVKAITGQWEGATEAVGGSMTARFYEDGTVKIWWYLNPLIDSYYFEGEYSINKKKLHLSGMACVEGSSLSSGWKIDRSVPYSLKNGVLKFYFDSTDWVLKAE